MKISPKTLVLASVLLFAGANSAMADSENGGHDHGAEMQADHDRTAHMVEGIGSIVAINTGTHRISLDHDPVPALKWPAMRMAFTVGSGVDLAAFKKGDKVQFTLHRAESGAFPIVELCPTASTAVVPGLCAKTIAP